MTYRSGPEWDERFGRSRISDENPSLCPTFVIESYLEHQGESFSTKFDPNSLLYISKVINVIMITWQDYKIDNKDDSYILGSALVVVTWMSMVIPEGLG